MSDPVEAAIRALVKALRDELASAAASPAAAEPQYVTVAEYARTRSISERTVREAIRDGRLPSIRFGRAVRIPSSARIERRAAVTDDVTERARLVLLGGGKRR